VVALFHEEVFEKVTRLHACIFEEAARLHARISTEAAGLFAGISEEPARLLPERRAGMADLFHRRALLHRHWSFAGRGRLRFLAASLRKALRSTDGDKEDTKKKHEPFHDKSSPLVRIIHVIVNNPESAYTIPMLTFRVNSWLGQA
jgi:hypothetical protein